MSIIQEFRAFITRGNVIDLAIGIIIGAAFSNIISSLVNNIIMPPLGLLTGGVNFKDQKTVLRSAVTDANGTVITPANTLNWGLFLQNVFEFLIIALAIFLIVKAMNALYRKKEEEPIAPEYSTQEKLLIEIRDALNK